MTSSSALEFGSIFEIFLLPISSVHVIVLTIIIQSVHIINKIARGPLEFVHRSDMHVDDVQD